MYQDRQFFERLLAQFGIEQDNTLGGTTAKDFKESFDNRVENGDPRYVATGEDPADAAENSRKPQDSIDENGRGIYSLGSLSTMSSKWTSNIYPNLIDKANTHMALACAFATYGNLAENSVRRAKMISIARFAMNYLAVADDIKSIADRTDNHIAVDVLANNLIQPLEQGGKTAWMLVPTRFQRLANLHRRISFCATTAISTYAVGNTSCTDGSFCSRVAVP